MILNLLTGIIKNGKGTSLCISQKYWSTSDWECKNIKRLLHRSVEKRCSKLGEGLLMRKGRKGERGTNVCGGPTEYQVLSCTVSFNQHKGRYYSHFIDDNGDTRWALAHNNNMNSQRIVRLPHPTYSRVSGTLQMKNSVRAVSSGLKANSNSKGRNENCSHCFIPRGFRLCCKHFRSFSRAFSPPLYAPFDVSVRVRRHSVGVGNVLSFLPCSILLLPVPFFLFSPPFFPSHYSQLASLWD